VKIKWNTEKVIGEKVKQISVSGQRNKGVRNIDIEK
jgi:hypothetical protein